MPQVLYIMQQVLSVQELQEAIRYSVALVLVCILVLVLLWLPDILRKN
jgi:hypothetical protein